jgi:hypothetical protein
VQRDLSDRDSQLLMYQAYGCALMSAKDAADVASVKQLGRLLEADLETVLAERPEDEDLVGRGRACAADTRTCSGSWGYRGSTGLTCGA